jgi:hypothetical protein
MATGAAIRKSDSLILPLVSFVGLVVGVVIAWIVANLLGFGWPSFQRFLCCAVGLSLGAVVPLRILRSRRLENNGNVDNLDALIIKTYEILGFTAGAFIAVPLGDELGYRSGNSHIVSAALGAMIGAGIGDLAAKHSRFNPETKVQL